MRRFTISLCLFIAAGTAGANTGKPAEPKKFEVQKLLVRPTYAMKDRQAGEARLRDIIHVSVTNLHDYVQSLQGKKIHLFLNSQDTGLEPLLVNDRSGVVSFRLTRNTKNQKLWKELLRDPFWGTDPKVQVSVGPEGGTPLLGGPLAFTLKRVTYTNATKFWLLVLIGALGLFAYLARKTEIIRDGPDFTDLHNKVQQQPYSLGRTQMACWFFLILFGFVFIWLISGDSDTLTASILTLMGISAATALGAAAVSSMSESRTSARRARLTAEQLALNTTLADVTARLNNVNAAMQAVVAPALPAPADLKAQHDLLQDEATLKNRLNEISRELALDIGPKASDWFVKDILTDENGAIALHRFQIVVWTVVLGSMFVAAVAMDLTMPEFNATLLALMGISAGTYLGFKLPQNS